MWDHVDAGREPARVGNYHPQGPLVAGDIRALAHQLDRLGYPDDCPVQVTTPLPPRDRRVVAFQVLDFTPPKEHQL